MNYRRKLLSLFLVVNSIVASSAHNDTNSTFIPVSDSCISYMGRVSRSKPDVIRFTYPGVSIIASFSGSSIKMGVKPGCGAFMIEIDNELPYRLNVGKNDSIVTLAEGLHGGEHTVKAMYILEGHEFKPEFRGFYLDKDCGLLSKPKLPERRIEFIGNSITCGFGVESDNPNDPFTYDTENFFYTYAARTARNLNAQHLVVARSGIGVYRNYGAPKIGCKECMPNMYEQTLFLDPTETWNHSLYIPDVVCVNLGTNDVSQDNYDVTLLENGYRNFMKKLRIIYPGAKIIMISGSMLNGKQLNVVKTTLDKIVGEFLSKGDKNIYRFDFSPQTGSLGIGASYHPSMRQQQKMASELTEYIRRLMSW